MTHVIETTPPNLLRLEACPQCEYSLEGLPDEGVCPECGRTYDQSVVIVLCYGPGPQKMNATVLAMVTIGLLACIVVTVLRVPLIVLRTSPQFLLMFAFGAVMCGLAWIDRALSPRAGVWLLWISPQGIGVQREFDPNSLLAGARKWIPIVWFPLYMFAGFVPLMVMGHWVFPVVFGTVMVFVMMFVMRKMQPKPNVPANGVQPALFGWSKLTRVQLLEGRRRRCRFRAVRRSWGASGRIVDVTFDATQDYAFQLKTRIEELSGLKVLLKRKDDD